MSPIRIVRVLEYTYATAEDAIEDQARWYVPANGIKEPNPRVAIRSVVMPMEVVR